VNTKPQRQKKKKKKNAKKMIPNPKRSHQLSLKAYNVIFKHLYSNPAQITLKRPEKLRRDKLLPFDFFHSPSRVKTKGVEHSGTRSTNCSLLTSFSPRLESWRILLN
jgi:hypothetical protein